MMMSSSEMIVPKWNLREEEVEGEKRKRSPHVQSHHHLIPNYVVVPMCSNNEVQELRWEKGQVEVHGVSECVPQRWSLESIVHQATTQSQSKSQSQQQNCMQSGSKRVLTAAAAGLVPVEESGCASASRDTDTATATATMMTWNSFESPRSFKTARIIADHDDSVHHDCSENQEGERMTKGEISCRSQSSARRSRAAAIHNLSERKRRDRINEKMKALQKLVPNASKTDKASMLDEVIEYLKQLQAQIHIMSNARNMPQMVMPLGMQQQLQMSLLARMGMGMGMGMLEANNLTRNVPPTASFPPGLMHPAAVPLGGTTPFVPPPFTMPPMVPPPTPLKPNVDAATISTDAYNTFLAQCMNMEMLSKMSALYRQQSSSLQQASNKAVNTNHAQGSSFTNSFAHSN